MSLGIGTAVVSAMFSPWNDACTSDDVLLGMILPPVNLKRNRRTGLNKRIHVYILQYTYNVRAAGDKGHTWD